MLDFYSLLEVYILLEMWVVLWKLMLTQLIGLIDMNNDNPIAQ